MIFSNIGRYSGPFNPFFYAAMAMRHLQVALHTWHLRLYPPFEEDALP